MNESQLGTKLRRIVDRALEAGLDSETIERQLDAELQALRDDRGAPTETPTLTVAQGTVASPGWAAGPVQRVTINGAADSYPTPDQISDTDDIDHGDIVVTPQFYPSMVDDIVRASGMIVYNEPHVTGRGPVVAREYGLPAIIDCPAITSRLTTGDVAVINARDGTVGRLKKDSSEE